MHQEAREWVELHAWPAPRVLEIGSRNLNGGVRDLFPRTTFYWGIDVWEGPGVDEVARAQDWEAPEPFDLVICTEVLEHVEDWPLIVRTASRSLREGGSAIFTMATDPRGSHSGIIPDVLQPGEYYGNVPPTELAMYLDQCFRDWVIDRLRSPGDLRVWAIR
jgi:SAM-dependent methyltransferase